LTLADVEAAGRAGDRLPLVIPDGDPLITIIYTSGSTGTPKGVMSHDSTWRQHLRVTPGEEPSPRVTVGYLPLAHGMGRLAVVYFTLVRGGRTVFVTRSDLSTLFEDIRAVRPTFLALVPRVSAMIYQHFQAELVRRGGGPGAPARDRDFLARAVMAEMRTGFLGDRLLRLMTSSAPTPPEVLRFLDRCFPLPIPTPSSPS